MSAPAAQSERIALGALAALIVFGLLFGLYGRLAFGPYRARDYAPAWTSAQWIVPAEVGANGYYRKTLFLSAYPRKAFVQLSAPDKFELYVNGTSVASETYVSVRQAKRFDISPYLGVGRNAIAVAVTGKTTPAMPALRAEIVIVQADGPTTRLGTDASWRAAPRRHLRPGSTLVWNTAQYDDTQWPPARPSTAPGVIARPLSVPPELYELLPAGRWIWDADRAARSTTLCRTFALNDAALEHAWLGIATDASYIVTVNGLPLGAAPPTAQFMDAYGIARFLHRGGNSVCVDALSAVPGGRLNASLVVRSGDVVIDLSSDTRWRAARGAESLAASDLGALQAVPLAAQLDSPSAGQRGYPALRVADIPPTLALVLHEIALTVPWIAAALAYALLQAGLFAGLSASWTATPAARWFELHCQPFTAASLALGLLLFLPYDVRIDQASVSGVAGVIAVLLLVAGAGAWLLAEIRLKRALLASHG